MNKQTSESQERKDEICARFYDNQRNITRLGAKPFFRLNLPRQTSIGFPSYPVGSHGWSRLALSTLEVALRSRAVLVDSLAVSSVLYRGDCE
jgi:hypothetical protein